MSSESLSDQTKPSGPDSSPSEMSLYQSLSRKVIFALFKRLRRGSLTVIQNGHRFSFGDEDGPRATLYVHDPACYKQFLHGGDLAAGRTYMEGLWDCDDLTALCRIFARNRELLTEERHPLLGLLEPVLRMYQWLRRNTRSGSRKNIQYHYDLSNDFFQQFLDDTLNYSCARFPRPDSSLEEASRHKMTLLGDKLDLNASHTVLEIGSGWGGLAIYLAERHGCRVVTTTISENQYDFCLNAVRERGLEDQITVLKQDYRDLEGQYDRVVSVEMIEAVGDEYLDLFFETCDRLLKPDGRFVLQAITIRDDYYDRYRRSTDFIKHFIFPGGCVPSMGAIRDSIDQGTSLVIVDNESQGKHYARTLRRWRQRFFHNIDSVRDLGFDDEFIRMWEYYLCYCEAGFTEQIIDNHQTVMTKDTSPGS